MKNRHLIVAVLLNLIALVIGIFVFFAAARQLAEVRRVEGDITGLESERQKLSQLRRLIESFREDKIKIDEYIVTSQNTDIFLEHLEVIARQVGVTMKVVSADTSSGLKAILSVSGSYHNIARYIELLSTTHYLISFGQISLQSIPDGRNVWTGNISIDLLSYRP